MTVEHGAQHQSLPVQEEAGEQHNDAAKLNTPRGL